MQHGRGVGGKTDGVAAGVSLGAGSSPPVGAASANPPEPARPDDQVAAIRGGGPGAAFRYRRPVMGTVATLSVAGRRRALLRLDSRRHLRAGKNADFVRDAERSSAGARRKRIGPLATIADVRQGGVHAARRGSPRAARRGLGLPRRSASGGPPRARSAPAATRVGLEGLLEQGPTRVASRTAPPPARNPPPRVVGSAGPRPGLSRRAPGRTACSPQFAAERAGAAADVLVDEARGISGGGPDPSPPAPRPRPMEKPPARRSRPYATSRPVVGCRAGRRPPGSRAPHHLSTASAADARPPRWRRAGGHYWRLTAAAATCWVRAEAVQPAGDGSAAGGPSGPTSALRLS